MTAPTSCQKCKSENIYPDGDLWICAECFHEMSAVGVDTKAESEAVQDPDGIFDANGNRLADGDSVVVIKDLKVKGASSSLKSGTKVKSIRLQPDGPDGHNISCKIDGFGAMNLKSEFVKKA